MASSVLFSFLVFAWYLLLFSVLFYICEHNPTASMTIKVRRLCFDNSQTIIRGLFLNVLTDGVNVNQLNMLGLVTYSEIYNTNPQNVCRVMLSDVLEISHMHRCS